MLNCSAKKVEALLPLGQLHAGAGDLIGRAEGEQALLHGGQLVAGQVSEDQLVAEAEHLAVHDEARLTGLVGDGVVPAEREELVAHDVAHGMPFLSPISGTRSRRAPSIRLEKSTTSRAPLLHA